MLLLRLDISSASSLLFGTWKIVYTCRSPWLVSSSRKRRQPLEHKPKAERDRRSAYWGWTNLSKADVSKAGNSFTAAATSSPNFTASSRLGAYDLRNYGAYDKFKLKLILLSYLNVKRKDVIMKRKPKKDPPSKARNSDLCPEGKADVYAFLTVYRTDTFIVNSSTAIAGSSRRSTRSVKLCFHHLYQKPWLKQVYLGV
ncbi:hypothetical protein QQP08_005056 [Theobroma cacao]|nr:hypothetical protein QQP08_005056 [Theobroma cacao]